MVSAGGACILAGSGRRREVSMVYTDRQKKFNALVSQRHGKSAADMQAELQERHKRMMGGVYYRSALDSNIQARLVEEVEKIKAKIPGSTVLKPPPGGKTYIPAQPSQRGAPPRELVLKGEKKREDALAKTLKDYKGDWNDVKDIARCTLVVEKAREVEIAWLRVRSHFGFSAGAGTSRTIGYTNGLQFHSEKIIKPESNPAGYSGYTVFVRSGGANANKAEIQINFPAMMYAKSLPEFRNSMPGREGEMQAKFREVPGGLGHKMYEVYRAQEQTPTGKAYAAACKLYYDYFRSDPPNMRLGRAALEAMRALDPPLPGLPPVARPARSIAGQSVPAKPKP